MNSKIIVICMLALLVLPIVLAECAEEGEYTSGPVSPEYYYGCCDGLEEFYPYQDRVGAGSLCYDPAKGIPECRAVGSESEGWYYSEGGLIRWDNCGEDTQCSVDSDCELNCGCGCGLQGEKIVCIRQADCFGEYGIIGCACISGECTPIKQELLTYKGVLTKYVTEPCPPDRMDCCTGGYGLETAERNYRLNIENIDVNNLVGEKVIVRVYRSGHFCFDFDVVEIRSLPIDWHQCFDGCLYDESCIPYGSRVSLGSQTLYCSFNGVLENQKLEGESCQNSYECFTNFCSNGVCYDLAAGVEETRSVAEKIWDFLRSLFRWG